MGRRSAIFALLLAATASVLWVRTETWSPLRAAPVGAATDRTVTMIGGGVVETELVAVSTALAGAGKPGVLLLDSPQAEIVVKPFLARLRPDRIVCLGNFPGGVEAVERRWGVAPDVVSGIDVEPAEYAHALVGARERAVVCPEAPTGQLLQAACLAAALPAPLLVLRGTEQSTAVEAFVAKHKPAEVIAVGSAATVCRALSNLRVTALPDEAATARAQRQRLRAAGPIKTILLTNPADPTRLSSLAPWVAHTHRAALILTNSSASDASAKIRAALADEDLAAADNLIILADRTALSMERRPNPAKGKDAEIEMEPDTPRGDELCTLATGRLFNSDRAVVPLMLARARLLTNEHGRRALVVSNPGGSLPLLETFSRNTARELRNAGYTVTTRFEQEVSGPDLRYQLPRHDVFLWEGHYKTLVETYGLLTWTEPLPPAFIFLQSCLALHEAVAVPLIDRGAVAVVGSSTRIYSATGGAFTLAYFDGLLYDDQTLGGALRQGKNFLYCYAQLKQKRLNGSAKLEGANLRSAWAFTLWGDPTLKLPRIERSPEALPALKHIVSGNTITLKLPEKSYPAVEVPPYRAKLWPNGRLGGLITRGEDDEKKLVPLAFAEVHLPDVRPGNIPRLTSKLPESRWVFQWDSRRRRGYLLVAPGEREGVELKFHIARE